MLIRSGAGDQVFERHKWCSTDGLVQAWVNDIIWTILAGPKGEVAAPAAVSTEAAEVCRQAIYHNGLEGMAFLVYGEKLRAALGDAFYTQIDSAKYKTELYMQEVHWLIGPKLGAQVVLVGDYAMRPCFQAWAGDSTNPRLIQTLNLWTPTLSTREEVITLLNDGGFMPDAHVNHGYVYAKNTEGIYHRIQLLGTLWDGSKNWALDIEREMWDRAIQYSPSFPIRFEATDLFLVACRRFTIDSLMGGGIQLLDLVAVLEHGADNIDWDRIRAIKNKFRKPDWFWAALLAVQAYCQRVGRPYEFPEWARTGLAELNTFYSDFLHSRMNWANPDLRLVDFTRAYVKLAKGT